MRVTCVCCHRATTHADLLLRAKECGIGTKVIHNASIINAIGCCGLQVYTMSSILSITLVIIWIKFDM